MSLPRQFMDEIRARVPLSEVIGKRTKLTRAGREFKGCCPFHKEKTASFTVNDQKGFYHCFGCGAHGDVVGFLMNHDNLSFMEAVEQLASQAGMQVPKPTAEEQKKFQRQMSLYDLMEAATKYYEQQLYQPQNKKILKYLVERGLSLETIKSFRLGYAASESQLMQYLQKESYKIEDIVEAGLYKASEKKKGEFYPFFRGRVMFPVQDIQGRVIAFGGRVLPEAYGGPPDKSAPKYINSPETSIFHKGKNLYGLSRARRAIGDGAPVIVVEGYMDVIALVQGGFPGAVAPLGTALTESQIEEVWKVMPEESRAPILCFDGDAAGQRAASRALERSLPILKPDHTVKFAFLPEEHDPDSLIKAEGAVAMRRVLENAIGLFDMLWAEESKGRDFTQPETKAGFRRELEKRARQIADANVQEFFVHEIGQRINDTFFSQSQGQTASRPVRTFFAGGGQFKGRKQEPPGAHTPYRPMALRVKPVKASNLLREKALIAVLVNYPQLFEEFGEKLGMLHIANSEYDQLRQALIAFLGHPPESADGNEIYLDDQAVKQHLIESGYGRTLEALFDKGLSTYAGFAKPGQSLDEVRQGWREAWEKGQGGIQQD